MTRTKVYSVSLVATITNTSAPSGIGTYTFQFSTDRGSWTLPSEPIETVHYVQATPVIPQSTPAWTEGTVYPAGIQVKYQGRLFVARVAHLATSIAPDSRPPDGTAYTQADGEVKAWSEILVDIPHVDPLPVGASKRVEAQVRLRSIEGLSALCTASAGFLVSTVVVQTDERFASDRTLDAKQDSFGVFS